MYFFLIYWRFWAYIFHMHVTCVHVTVKVNLNPKSRTHRHIVLFPLLTLAALRVVGAQAEEAGLALVAARPFHVGLAAALTGHHPQRGFGVAVAHPAVLGAVRVTVAS